MAFGLSSGAVSLIGAGAGLIGGAMGKKGASSTQSTQAQIDPRIADFVFGNGSAGNTGLLGSAQQLYQTQAAGGGLNDMQRAGMESQRQVLTHPSFLQGAEAQRGLGMGLLGAGVASNPFSTGQASLGGTSAQGLMAAGQGLLGGAAPAQQSGGLLGGAQMIRPAAQAYQPMQFDQNPTLQAAGMPIAQPQAVAPTQAQPNLDQEWKDYLDKMLTDREAAKQGPVNYYDAG